jgi:hypothetical protein
MAFQNRRPCTSLLYAVCTVLLQRVGIHLRHCIAFHAILHGMNPEPLTPDQTKALHAAGDKLPVIDVTTQQLYVVVDLDVHERAMEALREREDLEAIREGVAQVEAGEGVSIEEARKQTDAELVNRFGR